ncbi:acetyl-CoA C-acetyltransferase [Microbacterium sp. CFBP9034]|uniref:acetyl-CoA C-acetyltransferase n=1 Tax=Microbacterium sp. CFBP9034 TaxID=3096540 RepID=UPI002A6A6B31|nr:acetyl-CoA C-acetyltransferase [Microbacterium sp. CFBP9034]MDY0908271.1 acetyl-CoA C-acetyltransferase [Microbacterium sp. CFBP9034]
MTEAYVYDAVRTPRGRGKATGALHGIPPHELVVGLVAALRVRHPGLDPAGIDDIVLGCVTPIGDQGSDIAKVAALAAGLPDTVPGVQLNRFCGSGLEAVNQAAARVRSGWEDLFLAGGVESMSRVPMGSDGGPWSKDSAAAVTAEGVPQGISADLIATLEGYSREDVDRFAATSHERAARAWDEGRFDRSVVPVLAAGGDVVLARDEIIRPGTSLETLAALPPAFAAMGRSGFDEIALRRYPEAGEIDHVHHAGNSSGIVDGAALVLVGSESAGERHGLTPRARIRSAAVVSTEPTIMLTGPGPASRLALERAGLSIHDIDLVEINEAFASVALKLMRDLDDFPHERTNVNGGAIAMGHPLGATGAMILGTLIDELERSGGRYGLATLCIGGGMGVATVVELV